MVRRTQMVQGHEALFARLLIILGSVLLLMGLVSGCTGKKYADISPGLESRGSYIEGVPFYQQSEITGGASALASVFDFHGRPDSLERITDKIYLPELRVMRLSDMDEYARAAGFKTDSHRGSIGELKSYIRKGIPVISMLDLRFGLDHELHYVSVIGYDDVNEVFIVHDGLEPNHVVGYKHFNKLWVRADYWMLVIEPASEKAGK